MITKQRHDAALGAFLGACVGDAAGAVLEFYQDLSEFPEEVNNALTLTYESHF